MNILLKAFKINLVLAIYTQVRSWSVLTRALDKKQVGTHQNAGGEAGTYSRVLEEKHVGIHQSAG
jgi:hypothetical protein